MTSAQRAAIKRGLRQALSAALRELREKQRRLQKDIAQEAGLGRSYWGDLERGERTITLPILWQLAHGLGMTPANFVRLIDKHYRNIPERPPVPLMTSKEAAIKRLRDYMDQSPEMKWLGSAHAKTVYCNPPMLRYLGLTLADLQGRSVWQAVIHPDDRKMYVAKNNKAYELRQTHASRYRMRGADGQYKVFVEHAVPQFTPRGVFIGFLGTMIMVPNSEQEQES